MNLTLSTRLLAAAGAAFLAPAAFAQPFSITAYAISSGGQTTPAAAGAFTLASSIGDPLAAPPVSSGRFSLGGGFLFLVSGEGPAACYANCDGSIAPPILNVNDFICFQSAFAAGLPYANCDQSTSPPILNVNDFICFQSAFAAGCP